MTGRGQPASVLVGLADVDDRARRVAVGMFDGVHLGHREVMRDATCVVTFDPHPLSVLAPAHAPPLLTTLERRAELVAGLGIGEVVVIGFDAAFAAQGPRAFVDDVLVGALRATHVSVGCNFRFGHRGAGDPPLLQDDPRFVTRVVPLIAAGGATVSSTAIRALLALGDVGGAAMLLGTPFTLDARLVDGAELLLPPGSIAPAPGRYACRTVAPDGTPGRGTVDVERPVDGCADGPARLLLRDAPAARDGGSWRLAFLARVGVPSAVA